MLESGGDLVRRPAGSTEDGRALEQREGDPLAGMAF